MAVYPMPDSAIKAGKLTSPGLAAQKWTKRYKVQSDGSLGTNTGDGDPTYGHSATGYTQYATNAINVEVGVYLEATTSFNGTSGSWQVTYDGPGAPFGGYIVSGSGYRSSVSIEAVVRGIKLYALETGALPRIMWDAIDIYINGAFNITLPGSSVDASGAGVGPNYIPILGVPFHVSGGCSAGRTNVPTWSYNACDPGDTGPIIEWETAFSSVVSGGWKYEDEIGETDLPVAPYSATPPAGGGAPFGLAGYSVAATRSWGNLLNCNAKASSLFEYVGRQTPTMHVEIECLEEEGGPPSGIVWEGDGPAQCINPCGGGIYAGHVDTYRTTSESESASGAVTLQPNLPGSLKRLVADYAQLIYRGNYPQVDASVTRAWSVDGVTGSSGGTVTVFNDLSVFLGLVRDADHAVLDGLAETIYAPCSGGRSKSRTISYAQYSSVACICPPSWVPSVSSLCPDGGSANCTLVYTTYANSSESESTSLSFPSSVGAMTGNYQTHAVAKLRYLGSWANPFWQLFDWKDDWYLQGVDVPWATYWGPVRQQWCKNDALPSGENTRRRISIIAGPNYHTANTPFHDEFTGGMTWLGMSRFAVRAINWLASIVLDERSEPMFSSPDETATFSAATGGITITPTGTGPITVEIDLVRDDCYPWFALLAANGVTFPGWTNVGTITAELVSALDAAKSLNNGDPLTTDHLYPFLRGADDGYAGTWGSDDGAGYLADQGTDEEPGGHSAAVMADPERLAGFQMLPSAQGAKLRLTITPAATGDVVLEWPEFSRPNIHPEARWLDGNRAALIWPNGPGILFGTQLVYVPDIGLYAPWLPKPLGESNTIADVLQWAYAIAEATDPADIAAYNAEIVAWYDDFEVPNENIGNGDKGSFAVLLPKKSGSEVIRFAIVSTYAEWPPLSCWPTRARGNDWHATGDPAQERYVQAQDRHLTVSPAGAALVLQKPDGTPISTAYGSIPGWSVQRYSLALDGDELDNYRLVRSGTHFASAYPWKGWFWKGNPVKGPIQGQWNFHAPWRHYHRIAPLSYRRSPKTAPPFEMESALPEDSEWARGAFLPESEVRVGMVYQVDSDTKFTTSSDDGETFEEGIMLIENAVHPTINVVGQSTLLAAAFRYDSGDSGPGTIVAKVRGPGTGNTWSSEFTFRDGSGTAIAFEDDCFHFSEAPESESRLILVARKSGDDGPTEFQSSDFGATSGTAAATWEEI